jgi:hypothetical protein
MLLFPIFFYLTLPQFSHFSTIPNSSPIRTRAKVKNPLVLLICRSTYSSTILVAPCNALGATSFAAPMWLGQSVKLHKIHRLHRIHIGSANFLLVHTRWKRSYPKEHDISTWKEERKSSFMSFL